MFLVRVFKKDEASIVYSHYYFWFLWGLIDIQIDMTDRLYIVLDIYIYSIKLDLPAVFMSGSTTY